MTIKPVVIWDIDGTLVSGSLERSFISYLQEQGLTRKGLIAVNFLRLALRLPIPKWYQMKLCYLRGVSNNQLESLALSWWDDEQETKLFSGAREAVDHFSSAGIPQVVLSGTITPLAKQLAASVGISEIIAADPEVIDGTCSGRTEREHPHGPEKVSRTEEWLKDKGYTWADTIAIANHWDDRFLLEKCSRPIAAHPDDKLRVYAAERGWMIVDDLHDLVGLGIDG